MKTALLINNIIKSPLTLIIIFLILSIISTILFVYYSPIFLLTNFIFGFALGHNLGRLLLK